MKEFANKLGFQQFHLFQLFQMLNRRKPPSQSGFKRLQHLELLEPLQLLTLNV